MIYLFHESLVFRMYVCRSNNQIVFLFTFHFPPSCDSSPFLSTWERFWNSLTTFAFWLGCFPRSNRCVLWDMASSYTIYSAASVGLCLWHSFIHLMHSPLLFSLTVSGNILPCPSPNSRCDKHDALSHSMSGTVIKSKVWKPETSGWRKMFPVRWGGFLLV